MELRRRRIANPVFSGTLVQKTAAMTNINELCRLHVGSSAFLKIVYKFSALLRALFCVFNYGTVKTEWISVGLI